MPGPWKNERTPHLIGIMDAAGFSSVQTVILCKSPQTGGSECVHNFVGYCIDMAPGPVLYVYPDELVGRENMRDRIQPMIESSPRLRSYLSGVEDDKGLLRMKLAHMPIYIAWARSASRLSNKPIRYVIFDETDKYPETAGPKETDPISLGEARAITYDNTKKIFKISTPTTEGNFIWQAFVNEAQVIFDYWVRCPACGRDQKMQLERIRVPEDNHNANQIETKTLAWYSCAHCVAKWDDHQRNQAVKMGSWRERVPDDSGRMSISLDIYLQTYKPKKIGFHLPSWISPFVSLSKVMADWFRAQRDKTKLKDFFNKHAAEPWRQYTGERKEDYILKLKDSRPRGLVPAGDLVSGITAAVDTQDNGFFFEIRAWGYGFEQESWQIREGFADTFAALEQILWKDEYKDAGGKMYLVYITLIDAMGHRTAEVYDWCRKNRGRAIPIKGEERMKQPHAYTKIDTYPGTNKPIPGGIQLLRINTNYYKDLLAAKLEINPADPGSWHMHSEMSADWALMMVSEFVNDKGLWECKSGAANHAWDISGYGLAAADLIGLKFRGKERVEGQGARVQELEYKGQGSGAGVERPGWMSNR
jgi:phage terminase large subunit GpA-like protein